MMMIIFIFISNGIHAL